MLETYVKNTLEVRRKLKTNFQQYLPVRGSIYLSFFEKIEKNDLIHFKN